MVIDALLLAQHSTYLYVLFLPLFSIGVMPDYGGGKSLITLEWSTVFQLPGTVTDLAWLGAHSLNIRYRIFRISSLSNVSSIQRLSAQAP
jgi:hypothetical protein